MFYQVLVFSLYITIVKSITQCQKVAVPEKFWKNEGVAVIYVMKNTQQNWQSQVSSLIHLKHNLQNIGVNLHVTVATNKNCSAFQKINDFQVDGSEIWSTLEHHSDYPEALIIDRCGKVTYHIIFPWSLVKWFPFVKGAVLSTFFDKPCGPCDNFYFNQAVLNDPETPETIKLYPKIKQHFNDKRIENGVPPIEIIMKEKHRHEGSDEIFEYTEMELGNTQYHRHFHSLDDDEFLSYEDDDESHQNSGSIRLESSERAYNSEGHFKHSSHLIKSKRIVSKSVEQSVYSSAEPINTDIEKEINEISLICRDANDLEQDSKYYSKLFHNLLQAVYSPEEVLNSEENEKKDKLTNHYEQLTNWLSYIV